jgi:hypothetical protein
MLLTVAVMPDANSTVRKASALSTKSHRPLSYRQKGAEALTG